MTGTPLTPADAESLWAHVPHAGCVLDGSGRVLWANQAWEAAFAASSVGDDFLSAVCADDTAPLAEAMALCAAGGSADPVAARRPGETGASAWLEWKLAANGDGHIVAWGRDITQRRREGDAAGELRLLEDDAEHCAGLGSWRLDMSDGSLTWSPEMYRIFGVDPSSEPDLAEVTNRAVHPDDREMLEEINRAVLADGMPRPARYRIVCPDGDVRWVNAQGRQVGDSTGRVVALTGFVQDITERVAAEEALQASEQRYRSIIDGMQDAFFRAGLDGRLTLVNEAAVRMYGFDAAEQMIGIPAQDLYADHEERDDVIEQLIREGVVRDRIGMGLRQDGSTFWVSLNLSLTRDEAGVPSGTEGFARDVTERVLAEEALRTSEEDLSDAQAIARIGSYVYDIAADRWTSSATMDDIFGIDATYVRDLAGWLGLVHRDDREMMSLYFADDVVTRRLPFDKQYRVTRHCDGATVWVHGHGRLEIGEDGQPVRMIGAIQDVSERHRNEVELRETNEHLERMVFDVAEAMGRVIEIRDPYTQGHQQRTARLAKAIATEMGLLAGDVTAVEMAAVVHDIGKLSVPVEILSRPTALTTTEFSLIREHPHNGYEILKDIPFPWPVADIVLQHHERLDGSGYPGQMAGAEILPLARLLSVADVVEAMATHRPYRPALGLEAAIDELRRCPEKYDATVVKACMRLYERGEIEL